MSNDAFNFKIVDGGFVYRNADFVEEDEVKNSELKSTREATSQEKKITIAYKVASLTNQTAWCM